MKWFKFGLIAALVLCISGVAIADTANSIIRPGRPDTEFDISALPIEVRANEHVYFVDSSATDASDQTDGLHGKSWLYPFNTIDYALDKMASGGGTILVSPGHTESVISAGDWACDVAGVTIEGKGHGDNQPVITISTAASASVKITADDVTIRGLTFVCGIDSMVHGIDVNSADDLWIDDCIFKESTDVNGLTWITADGSDADADRMKITNCQFWCLDATNWTSAIEIAQDMTGVQIINTLIYGDFADACVEIPAGGNAQVGLFMENCTFVNTEAGDHALQINGTGNSGVARNCTFGADTAGAIVDAGGIFLSGCEIIDYDADLDTSPLQADLATIDTVVDAILVDTAAMDTSNEIEALVDPNGILLDSPRILVNTLSNFDEPNGYGAADDPVIFTVTGDIMCQLIVIVDTAITSTSNDTIEVGVTGDTACLAVQDVVDATAFAQNDVWTLDQAADTPSAVITTDWVIIPNGLDIKLTINDHDLTAGAATFILRWIPLSTDAAVANATPS